MKDILVNIWKLLASLVVIVVGFIQDLGGLFYVCMLGEKNPLFPVAISSLFLAFFLPLWMIAFLNNNRRWEEVKGFEKGCIYVSVCATIIFYLTIIATFFQ